MKTPLADATAVANSFRSGASDPVEALDACLTRIDAAQRILNCFVAIAGDARQQAAASARRYEQGRPLSPLDGVPVAVKDNLVVSGMPATWGSKLFADTICEADELPVARLRATGAIVLGKTNTPEFAVEGYTGNTLFGATGNAWNPELTPGGSSGGSASAVAAGLVPLALGTDGGGSIRRPAAYSGLVGLKPSIGRIARFGGLPQILLDFEVVGPLTRSVRDARLLLSLLSGPDPRDPASLIGLQETASEASSQTPLRILFAPSIDDAPCDHVISTSVDLALGHLSDLGHDVKVGALPFDVAQLNTDWPTIGSVGLARLMADAPDFCGKASPRYVAMAERGGDVRAADFARILEMVRNMRARAGTVFQSVDLIAMPACAAMPWPAGETHPERINGTPVGPRGHAVYTGWVNAAGLPAISLPCQPAPDGMPIGIQLVAGCGREDLLLDIATAYEAAHPWLSSPPTEHA